MGTFNEFLNYSFGSGAFAVGCMTIAVIMWIAISPIGNAIIKADFLRIFFYLGVIATVLVAMFLVICLVSTLGNIVIWAVAAVTAALT